MSFTAKDLATDRLLASSSASLPFLLLVTPTNARQCRERYLAGSTAEPDFAYRPLPDLDPYRTALASVEPDRAADPVLRHFFRALKADMGLRIDMLAERGSTRFREAGIQLFGFVERRLVELASDILAAPIPAEAPEELLTGAELVSRFETELNHYRAMLPTMTSKVELRSDTSGLVVNNGDLLIGAGTAMETGYVQAVAHHEVGVHILTHVNGHAQPLHILGTGLARYDELQEALGLIAEYLAGGLRRSRLRLLAARVLAAAHLDDDETFAATFDRLRDAGLRAKSAFDTAMRARRGGGMTKDAIYLRGLVRLLEYLGSGGAIAPLLLGKMSLEDLPLIEDLQARGLLAVPPLVPRFLDLPGAAERLRALKEGRTPLELGGITP